MRRWASLGISRTAVVEFEGRPIKSVRKAFGRAAADADLQGVNASRSAPYGSHLGDAAWG
jgi:hypothetical protein